MCHFLVCNLYKTTRAVTCGVVIYQLIHPLTPVNCTFYQNSSHFDFHDVHLISLLSTAGLTGIRISYRAHRYRSNKTVSERPIVMPDYKGPLLSQRKQDHPPFPSHCLLSNRFHNSHTTLQINMFTAV